MLPPKVFAPSPPIHRPDDMPPCWPVMIAGTFILAEIIGLFCVPWDRTGIFVGLIAFGIMSALYLAAAVATSVPQAPIALFATFLHRATVHRGRPARWTARTLAALLVVGATGGCGVACGVGVPKALRAFVSWVARPAPRPLGPLPSPPPSSESHYKGFSF